MIGTINTTRNFRKTARYVQRSGPQQVYANFAAALSNDADQIAQTMTTTAQQGVRVEQPCYHIALSPSPEDRLSQGDWSRLSEDFLSAMGLADRQAVGWLHHDEHFPDGRPRPHLHLVVNRVGELGQTYNSSWDYRRVDTVLRQLEHSYQLTPVAPAPDADRKRDTPGQVQRMAAEQAQYQSPHHPRATPPRPSVRRQLQGTIDAAIAQASTPADIAQCLSRQGIHTRLGERGWSFAKDGVHLAGHQLGRRYSLTSVETMVNQQSPAQQPTPAAADPQLKQRQRRRRLTMREIMQQSAAKDATSQQRQHSAQNLNTMGQRMMRDSEDVDGLTVIGGAIAATGAAVELGEAFTRHLKQARDQAQGKRATEQIEKLTEIGDRTTALEQTWQQWRSPETGEASQPPMDASTPDTNANAATQSLNLAQERLNHLGSQMGLDLDAGEPLELDPAASTAQQLDQMDQAITQLDQRLGSLETAVLDLATPAPNQPTGTAVADSLAHFIQARSQFRGDTEPGPFHSSAGVVTLSREGWQGQDTRLMITDGDYGTVFEAEQTAGDPWQVTINELQPEQADKITQLPQSADAYGQYKQGQRLLGALQALAPSEFEGDRGQVDWSSRASGFSYHFDVERQQDGSQQIRGRDTNQGDQVFSATRSASGDIFVRQNAIPSAHSEQLFTRREQVLSPDWEPSPERERPSLMLGAPAQPSRQRELEL